MNQENYNAGLEILKSCYLEKYDLYHIAYANCKVNKEDRKKLKKLGWHLQRHSRSNEEMWVFDDEEAIKKYELERSRG